MPPPRAINPEDKQRKRDSILDAASHLWSTQTDCISSMDALAQASGVAKGTLYLYFRSKEEVLLGLHERDVTNFFNQVIARAQQPEPMQLEELGDIVVASIRCSPTFLPLSNLCTGLMERQLPIAVSLEFKQRTFAHLDDVVSALQQHFPTMTCMKMMQGYALMLGLWQLLQQQGLLAYDELPEELLRLPCNAAVDSERFLQILHNALCNLFTGLLAQKDDAA